MIDRYTRPEMGRIWTLESRFQHMLTVEIAVAQAQAELGLIPKDAAVAIAKKSKFNVERILEIEKTTKHDVIAFVSSVAENVGPMGRYVHFGMTSSDVLDTALSLQIGEAGNLLCKTLQKLLRALKARVEQHAGDLCAGRTHGMHAEPTSFGLKMAGFYAEFQRHAGRLERALEQCRIGKLSGAVGTYSTQTYEVEDRVCKRLKLAPEEFATQVIPRDRHAEVLLALAQLGAGLERLAVELRHLQRTEVGEVVEGFTPGQKGSSAMPHKKNPISGENLTGCARLLRGYALAEMESVALWHERDISHSAVERVALPDAFILADYATARMAETIEKLFVDVARMRVNMELSQGQLMSSHLLLALVEKGLSREDAYALVQKLSHSLKRGQNLAAAAQADKQVRKLLSAQEIAEVFAGRRHQKAIQELLKRRGFKRPASQARSR